MRGVDLASEPPTSERPRETWMSASVKLAPGASLNAKVTTELLSPSLSAPSTMSTARFGFARVDGDGVRRCHYRGCRRRRCSCRQTETPPVPVKPSSR